MFDLIIIGGSAAATSAGIYAARRNLNFKIISKDFGGEVATSGEIGNYPGVPNTDGITLSDIFKNQLKDYGVEPELGVGVTSIEKKEDGTFCINAKKDGETGSATEKLSFPENNREKCDYLAKSIIITTGVHPRELNVPGEKEYRTKGVSYCTTCDGPLFKGKITATIGGGNSALESGIMLATISEKVYVINKNPEFKGDQVLIDNLKSQKNAEIIYNASTSEILGDGKLVSGLKYKDGEGGEKELKVDGVFIHIGMIPNSELVPEDVEKNEFKEIKVNMKGETNIPGFYAAGDVTNVPYKQIGIAVGQGISAILSVVDYLNKLKK